MAGLVKWLVVPVRQKVTICVPWFSCIRSFATVYSKNTIIYDLITEKYDRLRFPYFTVFRRIRSRTYTIVIRSHVLWRNTVVYDRLRPFTESVTVDLGTSVDDIEIALSIKWYKVFCLHRKEQFMFIRLSPNESESS